MTKQIQNNKYQSAFAVALLQITLLAVTALGQPTGREEEQKLIAVLGSAASLQEKDAACARLKRIGTVSCVPALATLLTDKDLSHSARYALEPMADPAAGKALVEAVARTSGGNRIGIINSLAMRKESSAVPALISLLQDTDSTTACAAASALGELDDPDALSTLQSALQKSKPPVRRAIVDACLRAGNRMLNSRNNATAVSVFQQLFKDEPEESIREAAFAGSFGPQAKTN